ncbi:hypothetical protein, partial [Enterobacter hormaechei]|uniref:hypothetical protein n=1 Tax=Enterobacter hormaechei TaxID=158836 RepID=UPI0033161113
GVRLLSFFFGFLFFVGVVMVELGKGGGGGGGFNRKGSTVHIRHRGHVRTVCGLRNVLAAAHRDMGFQVMKGFATPLADDGFWQMFFLL